MGPAALDKVAERHAATEIAVVFVVDLEVVERLDEVFPGLPHRLMPYEGVPPLKHTDPTRSQLKDHVRRVQGECGIEVAAIERLSDASSCLL